MNRYMKFFSILSVSLLVSSSLLVSLYSAQSENQLGNKQVQFSNVSTRSDSIIFSESHHISELSMGGIDTSSLTGIGYRRSIPFDFDLSSCSLKKTDMYTSIQMDGLSTSGSPGDPLIPMKTMTLTIPGHITILDVEIVDGEYHYIENPIFPAPKPEPVFWSESLIEQRIGQLTPNVETYTREAYYPGEILSYDVGYTTEKTVIYVRIYPVQYKPCSREALLISQGQIELIYEDESNDYPQSTKDNSWENIIISPPSFYNEAVKLCEFHNSQGTISNVMNTTWISDNYDEAKNPPYPGFDNMTELSNILFENQLQGYNFSLAKKIISFLNDTSYHPELTYVTLLGTARMVPPSYYVFSSNGVFVPTDFFYASPEYDLVTNYKVGRLPVDTVQQAGQVVNKIINWKGTTELFNNITVAGGKPFGTPFDIGEMIIVDMLNQGLLNGINPKKCFRTENSFHSEEVLQSFMGGTGLLYHIGHGSGTQMVLEGDPIDVSDLLSLQSSDTNPIVISIGCMNGAFDTHVGNMSYDVSFAESVLLSNAGGIAYIGGSRNNAGTPVFNLENGYLHISDETYMARLLTDVFKCFANECNTLGELTDYAVTEYVKKHDFMDSMDEYTLFCFTLLGDPAMHLPSRSKEDEYDIFSITSNTAELMIESDKLPLSHLDVSQGNNLLALNPLETTFEYNFISSSPIVKTKIIDCFDFNSPLIEKNTFFTGGDESTYQFTPENSSIYNFRVITEDGKEGWFFSVASRMVDDDYSEEVDGFEMYRFNTINSALADSEINGIIYVWNGTYTEKLQIDNSYFLVGENRSNTIIDSANQGTVIQINGGSSMITSFSIMNTGSSDDDCAGIEISNGDSMISNNIIRNNGKYGVRICGEESIPFVESNIIEENMYGIFVESGIFIGLIAQNEVYDNTIGMSISNMENQIIMVNIIESEESCLEIYDSEYSIVMANEFKLAKKGVHLEETQSSIIALNNFFDNKISAGFKNAKGSVWLNNYWDHGRNYPKFIFGTRGKLGLFPWINIDMLPSKEPIPIEELMGLI